MRKIPVTILVLLLVGACASNRMDHREVAQKFVNSFHKYAYEAKSQQHGQLAKISSDYTLELIKLPNVKKSLIPDGEFKYIFVKDSITPDKMRSFVWYTNGLQEEPRTIYRLPLRQSLKGWIVDLPII